jgi:UDP-galactopyranose mutase
MPTENKSQIPTLLYLAHLRWDHVWQRPQQLMTRFAERCPVIYVNPPEIVNGASRPHLEEHKGAQGVSVLNPVFPGPIPDGPGELYRSMWLGLLPETLSKAGGDAILWVSSPLADYLVEAVRPRVRLAVYDCMDDLASFQDGTHEMRVREDHLFRLVDLVFTGGYSMYMARKDKHPRIYCFPSGVDVAHYRRTLEPSLTEAEALSGIPHPRLGYFGVLDERIDWPLIAALAQARPDWHWVLVGPTAKVKDDELPTADNIHYLGQQLYEDLPAFLKGFDIATMPFALNEATRYISPTKTLEYLAGGKPVLSTSVPDVVAFYTGIAYIADGPGAWLNEIASILRASDEERRVRTERAEKMIAELSWDSITARMWDLIEQRLRNV